MAQQDTKEYNEKTLFETVSKIEKKSDKFNLYLNMHGSFNARFNDGDFTQGAFQMDQLRIEAKGNVNSWLYYRWRQRLNRPNNASGSIDNMPTSIDYAAIGVRPTSAFSILMGKQCTVYGGFEFDLNPIDIYEYSDMIDNMSNFMTGVNFSYDFAKSQQLQFQILDSRNNSFEDTYGKLPSDIKDSKMPLVYSLNWNGSFADGMVNTRWSASILNEAKGENMYYYAFGTELNLDKVNTFFDVMYSREDIDRKGIMTGIINSDLGERTGYTALGAEYLSLVWKLNYRVAPKWNLFVKGMYETAGLSKNNELREKGKYRTSWGYLGGVEYYPMKSNLHFFLTYIGRSYQYTDLGKARGFDNYNTSRISTGFIYQLPMF
ncbi:MAG: porin [Bacteroidales bacterium]